MNGNKSILLFGSEIARTLSIHQPTTDRTNRPQHFYHVLYSPHRRIVPTPCPGWWFSAGAVAFAPIVYYLLHLCHNIIRVRSSPSSRWLVRPVCRVHRQQQHRKLTSHRFSNISIKAYWRPFTGLACDGFIRSTVHSFIRRLFRGPKCNERTDPNARRQHQEFGASCSPACLCLQFATPCPSLARPLWSSHCRLMRKLQFC